MNKKARDVLSRQSKLAIGTLGYVILALGGIFTGYVLGYSPISTDLDFLTGVRIIPSTFENGSYVMKQYTPTYLEIPDTRVIWILTFLMLVGFGLTVLSSYLVEREKYG